MERERAASLKAMLSGTDSPHTLGIHSQFLSSKIANNTTQQLPVGREEQYYIYLKQETSAGQTFSSKSGLFSKTMNIFINIFFQNFPFFFNKTRTQKRFGVLVFIFSSPTPPTFLLSPTLLQWQNGKIGGEGAEGSERGEKMKYVTNVNCPFFKPVAQA